MRYCWSTVCLFGLIWVVARGDEPQEPLKAFSVHCCPPGQFLHQPHNLNSTCVNRDGSPGTDPKAINIPKCADGMFLLNPNEEDADVFREEDGEIELVAFYDTEGEAIMPNGSSMSGHSI
jgi:hypothetical protein